MKLKTSCILKQLSHVLKLHIFIVPLLKCRTPSDMPLKWIMIDYELVSTCVRSMIKLLQLKGATNAKGLAIGLLSAHGKMVLPVQNVPLLLMKHCNAITLKTRIVLIVTEEVLIRSILHTLLIPLHVPVSVNIEKNSIQVQ